MRGIRQSGGVLKNVWLGRESQRRGTKRTGFGERGKNYTKELRLRRKKYTGRDEQAQAGGNEGNPRWDDPTKRCYYVWAEWMIEKKGSVREQEEEKCEIMRGGGKGKDGETGRMGA